MSLKQNIDDAIDGHAEWKARFREFLAGRISLDVPHMGQCDQCHLGEWLEHEGHKDLPKQDYDEVHALHAEFHRIAAEVIAKIKHKDIAGAAADLAPGGAFDNASVLLSERLLKIAQHCTH